ncbi:hypothetical protein SAMN05421827_102243 [Pedobacter terrae]|uniref:Uncharacterized protein n=1 Tax=Pedobacter terrae TaxID=405671 RepID=A0A1G7QB42_9SPHI|nr:hypothetical protein SAMN05421827_102243 [Pedobacter terrae]
MDQCYSTGCSELYFYHRKQIDYNANGLDAALILFIGVLLIAVLTVILDYWQRQQFK